MGAICVGHIRVKDADAWEQYRSRVGATIAQYGGRVLFRGQQRRLYSGEMAHEKVVALGFEHLDAANRWHDSPEYQALLPIREQAADVTLVLYESQEDNSTKREQSA
jgi:uncharacterized protein (DUF1330 family)